MLSTCVLGPFVLTATAQGLEVASESCRTGTGVYRILGIIVAVLAEEEEQSWECITHQNAHHRHLLCVGHLLKSR